MSFREDFAALRTKRARVLVVGLGISGVAAAEFLAGEGLAVRAAERQPREAYLAASRLAGRVRALEERRVELRFGIEGAAVKECLEGIALCVLSPGISLSSPLYRAIADSGIRSISEFELGVALSELPAVVATGSNGKSTCVTLIHHLLCAGGIDARLCGNIGTPVVTEAGEGAERGEMLVLEASSYQLESTTLLRPKIGVLLNVSENHLERHGSLDAYLGAKLKLFERQDRTDFAVLNADDARVAAAAAGLSSSVLMFGREVDGYGARIDYAPSSGRDFVLARIPGSVDAERYNVQGCRLIGLHNRYNIAAAVLAARLLGVRPEVIADSLNRFAPLEHRLELLAPADGVRVINDSKSTTVASSSAAIDSTLGAFPRSPLVVLLGGQAKLGSWKPIGEQLSSRRRDTRAVICFGKDGARIAAWLAECGVAAQPVAGVAEAAALALETAEAGDTVLFTPGCASFDQFSDFEERGNVFKSLIRRRNVAHG